MRSGFSWSPVNTFSALRTSPLLLAIPGFATMAHRSIMTAVSSMKTESGCLSSAPSTVTSRPHLLSVPT